jgi:hypothetical protein
MYDKHCYSLQLYCSYTAVGSQMSQYQSIAIKYSTRTKQTTPTEQCRKRMWLCVCVLKRVVKYHFERELSRETQKELTLYTRVQCTYVHQSGHTASVRQNHFFLLLLLLLLQRLLMLWQLLSLSVDSTDVQDSDLSESMEAAQHCWERVASSAVALSIFMSNISELSHAVPVLMMHMSSLSSTRDALPCARAAANVAAGTTAVGAITMSAAAPFTITAVQPCALMLMDVAVWNCTPASLHCSRCALELLLGAPSSMTKGFMSHMAVCSAMAEVCCVKPTMMQLYFWTVPQAICERCRLNIFVGDMLLLLLFFVFFCCCVVSAFMGQIWNSFFLCDTLL